MQGDISVKSFTLRCNWSDVSVSVAKRVDDATCIMNKITQKASTIPDYDDGVILVVLLSMYDSLLESLCIQEPGNKRRKSQASSADSGSDAPKEDVDDSAAVIAGYYKLLDADMVMSESKPSSSKNPSHPLNTFWADPSNEGGARPLSSQAGIPCSAKRIITFHKGSLKPDDKTDKTSRYYFR